LLCPECSDLKEVEVVQRTIKERVFDASNEGEHTMDFIDMSFNKSDFK